MSNQKFEFTKENVDFYLSSVAKEYRKRTGKNVPAELIIIGGASVLINYGFRNMTTDVDAIIQAASSMKDAINAVADKYNLPNGWLNADFKKTDSYSAKLIEFSKYYRTFSNIVTVRTIDGEYLIAMKLKAGRQYKNDLSDILGILTEHEQKGDHIDLVRIKAAYESLYGDWNTLQKESLQYITDVISKGSYKKMYDTVCATEKAEYRLLLESFHNTESKIEENTAEYIISVLRKPKSKSNK